MTQNPYRDILEPLRSLRLPIERGRESDVRSGLLPLLSVDGEPLTLALDRATLIADLHLEGERHPLLDDLVKTWVTLGMPNTGGAELAPRYLRLLDKLSNELLSRDLAAGLLSEAPLVHRLADQQGMSATQIAMVLSQVLGGTFFPYGAVAQLMAALKVRPMLDSSAASQVVSNDRVLSGVRFAGASIPEASTILGEVAHRLGFPDDAEAILNLLCPPESSQVFVPYLQALDFVCLVADRYDHPPQFLYEFAPRGAVANAMFESYPVALAPGGNPILNNFKAVEAADRAWARSRPSPQSHALVSLLDGLSKMPYEPRRDLAAWIRQWLVHVVALLDATPIQLLDVAAASDETVGRLLTWVAAGNTESGGAVEQRVVDALGCLLHPPSEGWRVRGLGDATTISNLSRKKLGDVEFQNAAVRRVESFEPHGGRLSLPYLEGHLRSVRRVIAQRVSEWKAIADLTEWRVDVLFLAHDLAADLQPPGEMRVDEVLLTIRTEAFGAFIDRATASASMEALLSVVSKYVFEALNRREAPQSLRDAVAARCGLPLVAG